MHKIAKWAVAFASALAAVLWFAARHGIFVIGATTVVEDAQGIPGKVRAMIESVQAQPAIFFYGVFIVLVVIAAALLIPPEKWSAWWASRSDASKADIGSAKDHNVISYGQTGGITAYNVHLHQYAAPAAWMDDHRRLDNGALTHRALRLALMHSVSRNCKGYWQR
jgi:hypothetical protein